MRRILIFGSFVAAFLLIVALVAAATAPRIRASVRIKVIEHANTDTVVDTGGAGDTTGDLLTFANPIYNASDTTRVGRDQGDCVRIDPAKGTWECRWVTFVPGGSIVVEGPFYDTHDGVLAVTGGTGLYRNARGTMGLESRAGGTKYNFIFDLIP